MNKDMYFLPLIAKGLRRPHPEAALGEALREIERQAQREGFRIGWRQFGLFLDEVLSVCRRRAIDGHVCEIIANATAFDQVPQADVGARNRGGAGSVTEELGREILLLRRPEEPSLALRDNRGAGVEVRAGEDGAYEFTQVSPGHYELVTDTDCVIWAGRLSAAHVLLPPPSSTSPLRMAASTTRRPPPPTLVTRIRSVGYVLRVSPGRRGGLVRVEPASEEGGNR